MLVTKRPLTEPVEYIYSQDPALDRDAADFAEKWRLYRERGDSSVLPLKPGQKPAVWRLRQLAGKPRRRLRDFLKETQSAKGGPSETGLYVACQIALAGVSGLRDQDGREVELVPARDDDGFWFVTEESMAMLDQVDDGALIMELGLLVVLEVLNLPGK